MIKDAQALQELKLPENAEEYDDFMGGYQCGWNSCVDRLHELNRLALPDTDTRPDCSDVSYMSPDLTRSEDVLNKSDILNTSVTDADRALALEDVDSIEAWLSEHIGDAAYTPFDRIRACLSSPQRQEWQYCPECGSSDHQINSKTTEKICMKCGQSWFSDIDYTETVQINLRSNVPRRQDNAEMLYRALHKILISADPNGHPHQVARDVLRKYEQSKQVKDE